VLKFYGCVKAMLVGHDNFNNKKALKVWFRKLLSLQEDYLPTCYINYTRKCYLLKEKLSYVCLHWVV